MSGVLDILFGRLEGVILGAKVRAGLMRMTMGADLTVTAEFPFYLVLDPAAASRNVIMPLETANPGLMFLVFNNTDNTTAETILIRDNANAVTKGTIVSDADLSFEMGLCICDGVSWRVLVGAET